MLFLFSLWMALMGQLDPAIESSIVLISYFCKHLWREFDQAGGFPSAAPEMRFPRGGRLEKRRPPLSPPEFSRLRARAETRKVGPRKIALFGDANGSVDRDQ
jgi:hypothetical protein